MKTNKIIFWVSTIIIVLMEGVLPALTFQTKLAREGISHLGYPAYFGTALVIFKIIGALILLIPQLPSRLKEWAYAGFAFDFVFAAISHFAVDGLNGESFFPLVFLAVLAASYVSYHRLQMHRQIALR